MGKEMTLSRNESLATEKVSGEQNQQEHTPSSPFPPVPRMFCIFHFHRKKVILPVFHRGSGKGHYWKTFHLGPLIAVCYWLFKLAVMK